MIAGLIGILGGLVAAKATEESTETKMFLELRSKHADEMAKQFGRYVEAQSRIKTMCTYMEDEKKKDDQDAAEGKVSEAQKKKNDAIYEQRQARIFAVADNDRKPARDALEGELGAVRLYFRQEVGEEIDRYLDWEGEVRNADCKAMPAAGEWKNWQRKILSLVKPELSPKRSRFSKIWEAL